MDVDTEVCHGQLLVNQNIRKMGASVGSTFHPCATSHFHMGKGEPQIILSAMTVGGKAHTCMLSLQLSKTLCII